MNDRTMTAAYYERKRDAAEVLRVGRIEKPAPLDDEVLVRVHASAVNPSDTKGRGGARGNTAMPYPRIVPHQDGAGVIEAVGAGVDPRRIGERVWVYEAQLGRPNGTAAEYTSVPSRNAVALPDATGFAEGACLGVPALTAHRAVFADGPVSGKTVLVTGGAGAVGFYAIQFAKHGGAFVLATVSNAEQAAVAHRAGADAVINRKEEDVVAAARAATGADSDRSVDRIVDVAFGANLATSLRLLRARGVIASYASDMEPAPAFPFWDFAALDATVRCVLVYAMGEQAHLKAIAAVTEGLEQRWLQHNIAIQLPLGRIAEAHERVEAGHASGKVILNLGEAA